jgi:DHA3 family macrolide efflux protein-like MFS transporter
MTVPVSASSVTARQVLANRQFFAVWLAQGISSFGDWLAVLALFSLVAFREHATPDRVGGVFIAYALPFLIVGPIGGVLVDRWNLKATMIASDVIRAGLALALAFTTTVWQMYALFFLIGAVSAVFVPAQAAAVPLIVSSDELIVANALNAQATQLTKIVSPAIAGALAAMVGERACFVIDSLTFVCSALLLSRIAVARRQRASDAAGIDARAATAGITETAVGQLGAGLAFLWRQRRIRVVLWYMLLVLFAAGVFNALVAVYVRDTLASGSAVFGGLVSLIGVGTIVGAGVVARFAQRCDRVLTAIGGAIAFGIGLFLLANATTPIVAWCCGVIAGAAVAVVLVPSQTLLQEETPEAMRGRVMSLTLGVTTACQLVGVAIAGPLAGRMGITRLYEAMGLALAAAAAAGWLYVKVRAAASTRPVSQDA